MYMKPIPLQPLKPLSKSDYKIGLECPGLLWMKYHYPEKIPPHPLSLLKRFDEGHLVGQMAKKLFPEGVDIPERDNLQNMVLTKELLPQRKVLFEAGILVDNLYARADILVPAGKDAWDIIEVKSSTKVKKDEHFPDVAFQRYVYEKSGLKIRKCYVMVLNSEYVRKGEIDLQQIFVKEEVTEKILPYLAEVPTNVKFLGEIIQSPVFPNSAQKNYCTDPKGCLVKEECWGFLPEHHVFNLYNSRKAMQLFQKGILALRDVPEEYLSNDQQKIQWQCEKTGKVHFDKKRIQAFLKTIQEPACYLDFETCAFAIPGFSGTRPYQRMPFQFSLHVVGKKTEHLEYLHDGKDDPRPGFLTALKKSLPSSGSVLVYFEGFEGSVLKELARDFPEYLGWVDSVLPRFVDLHKPFKEFWYYNPKQQGSASLKKVLPALVGKGYEGMAIQDGDCATIAYLDMTFGKMTAEMKQKTREDLLKYCGLDTEGMVWMVNEMKNQIKKV